MSASTAPHAPIGRTCGQCKMSKRRVASVFVIFDKGRLSKDRTLLPHQERGQADDRAVPYRTPGWWNAAEPQVRFPPFFPGDCAGAEQTERVRRTEASSAVRSLLPRVSLCGARTTGPTAALRHEELLRHSEYSAASARSENLTLPQRARSQYSPPEASTTVPDLPTSAR